MQPQTLPLVADFKKTYKFLWFMDGSQADFSGANMVVYKSAKETIGNIAYCTYISQLCEEVRLPEDDFEIANIDQGPVTFQYPKRVKLHDIQVTYLEDSLNSVYNFHRTWFDIIRGGNGINWNIPNKLCCTARYIEFEDTMTTTEFLAFIKASSVLDNLAAKKSSGLNSIMSSLKPELPIGSKPTGITVYPKVYPIKISRSSANKGGSDLHKVTVTYARIPKLAVRNAPLMKTEDGINWKPSAEFEKSSSEDFSSYKPGM